MKQCAICGQTAERGSKCGDCRAAIKRARDETVSQFEPAPMLALASGGNGARVARARPGSAKARLPTAPTGMPAQPITLHAERGSGRGHASPFVWVIVVLMVLVAIFVSAGVINAALEAARASRPGANPGDHDLAALLAPLPAVAGKPAALALAPLPRALPSADVEAAVEARMAGVRSIRDVPSAGRAAGRGAPVPAAVADKPAGVAAGLPTGLAPAPAARVETVNELTAPSRPAAPVVSAATARTRVSPAPRPDRWERMDVAMRACAGQDFFRRVVCEQKVRFEYCDGFWGQKTQCPGNPGNDQGQ
ncbi:MAG: hypothetical protein ABIS17_14230 [Casimicrobiaceae bacterium]